MGKYGTECVAYGCNKRRKRKNEDIRSDSEGSSDAESMMLLSNEHYARFYTFALESLAMNIESFPYYKLFCLKYIEIAIWPLLYIKNEFCESGITGHSSRLSCKRLFHYKCMSPVVDFGQDFS